jgi:hypothetical protein
MESILERYVNGQTFVFAGDGDIQYLFLQYIIILRIRVTGLISALKGMSPIDIARM